MNLPKEKKALKRKHLLKEIYKYRMAYVFILPTLILISVFMVFPLLQSFRMSLYDWDGILSPVFIGFENFKTLFTDTVFLTSVKNNLLYTIITTILTVLLGFLFAVAIERTLKGHKLYKFAYFVPVMMSLTVVGVLFNKIYEPTFGLLNSFLDFIGLGFLQQAWLGDPDLAIYSIIAVSVWQLSGFTMLLFLAGVEGIPSEIHDAATIDGVNGWQRMTKITFPMIKRVFYVVTMLQIINSFKVFDIVWVMTKGGPSNSSEVMGTYLYKEAFISQKFGYSSAIAVMMTIIVVIVSIVYLRLANLSDHQKE